MDLSALAGASINDAVHPDLCSLRYASPDDVTLTVKKLGRGTLLVKLGLKKAYNMTPVHPDDHTLLGIRWDTDVYTDTILPFGLHLAPNIFSELLMLLCGCCTARVFDGISSTLMIRAHQMSQCVLEFSR